MLDTCVNRLGAQVSTTLAELEIPCHFSASIRAKPGSSTTGSPIREMLIFANDSDYNSRITSMVSCQRFTSYIASIRATQHYRLLSDGCSIGSPVCQIQGFRTTKRHLRAAANHAGVTSPHQRMGANVDQVWGRWSDRGSESSPSERLGAKSTRCNLSDPFIFAAVVYKFRVK